MVWHNSQKKVSDAKRVKELTAEVKKLKAEKAKETKSTKK